MAKEDASVAIQNALHKLDQQPNLLHNDTKLKSVKSKLQRLGSHLDRFNSTSELTRVREIAYDVEDAMDDAIMVAAANAAHQRWRKLGNLFLFLFFSGAQQRVEEQIEAIDIRSTAASIDNNIIPSPEGDVVEVVEEYISIIPPEEDLFAVFYLSLSGFPAEVEISGRQLVQIWAAEGFLDQHGNTSTAEQGREQISWLLERGFIKQAQTGTCGDLKTFRIEQDKLDACISAAKAENFLHVGETSETVEATRLAVHNQSTILLAGNNSKVRSLHIHNNTGSCVVVNIPVPVPIQSGLDWDRNWKKGFELLRVLDLGCIELETVPEAIGKLVHLKYLKLRAPQACKIPASICDLPNLQTIDLKETTRVKAMPVEIWKMKTNLRHLHLGGATALPQPRRANHYDALQSLQTLCGVRPDKELKRLMVRAKFPNVNRLRLHASQKDSVANKEEFVSFLNSIDLLYHLRSLTLRGPIGGLPPDWNAFPSSLMKMTLLMTRIPAEKCVKTLQNLPSMRYLKLMEDSVAGDEMKFASGGFPALEVLRMEGLKDLECWRVEKDAVRLLRELKVGGCDKFSKVEAFQPSKKLEETLQKLKSERKHMTVDVYPLAATAE